MKNKERDDQTANLDANLQFVEYNLKKKGNQIVIFWIFYTILNIVIFISNLKYVCINMQIFCIPKFFINKKGNL